MKNILTSFFKTKIVPIKEKTTLELISESIACKPMNKLEFGKDGRAYLNPTNQNCFNSGWYSEQDFKDWLNGTGNIVKGKTQSDKDKFFDYALFVNTYKLGWMVASGYKHFNLINEKYNFVASGLKFEKFIENPIKITSKNKDEVISNIYGFFVNNLKERFEYARDDNYDFLYGYNSPVSQMLYAIKMILTMLGLGYYGYSNTPSSINNFNWLGDVLIAKAYYLYLTEKGDVVFPDFDFVEKNYYKM